MKQELIPLLPFLMLVVVYGLLGLIHAGILKLSAKLLGGALVRWKHVLVFAMALAVLSLAGRVFTFAAAVSVSMAFGLLAAFALHLAAGGWYFRARATTGQGRPFGWWDGARLAAVAFVLFNLAVILPSQIVSVADLPHP